MTKTWYNVDTGHGAVFEDNEDITNWPDFQETKPAKFVKEDVYAKRAALLGETDIWALTDRPPLTEAQAAYRQALRDISDQADFPENVTWPTKP
tara:strand:+ start:287 stop:568 length:282 start_codon:yes stop_codon:yes gene_type:complete